MEIDSVTKELCVRVEIFDAAGVSKGWDPGLHPLCVVIGVCDVVIVQPIRERRKVEGTSKQKSGSKPIMDQKAQQNDHSIYTLGGCLMLYHASKGDISVMTSCYTHKALPSDGIKNYATESNYQYLW